MSNTQILRDDYRRTGTDLLEFQTALEEMDAMTSLKTVTTLDIELLSMDRLRGIVEGQTAFRVFNPHEGETAPVGLTLEGKEKLAPLAQELRANQLLLRIGGKIYFTSNELMFTMSTRAGLGGPNIARPSTLRDAYIARSISVNVLTCMKRPCNLLRLR